MIPFPEISPEIFTLNFGELELTLRWYAVAYVIGFFLSALLIRVYVSRQHLWRFKTAPLDIDQVEILMTYLILGVLIGGRLGYVAFYNIEFYVSEPINVLKVWDGGMSFHGGFLGVVLAAYYYCRYNGIIILSCADVIALSAGPGIFLGRVANFVNGELWGRPTSAPWGVVFPSQAAQECVGVVGQCARHPSQLYEALIEGLLLFIFLVIIAHRGALRRPGLITGSFLLIYGLGRYFVEFYRVPDPQFFSEVNTFGFAFKIGDWGMTMGQALSMPMIVFGAILILLSVRQSEFG